MQTKTIDVNITEINYGFVTIEVPAGADDDYIKRKAVNAAKDGNAVYQTCKYETNGIAK